MGLQEYSRSNPRDTRGIPGIVWFKGGVIPIFSGDRSHLRDTSLRARRTGDSSDVRLTLRRVPASLSPCGVENTGGSFRLAPSPAPEGPGTPSGSPEPVERGTLTGARPGSTSWRFERCFDSPHGASRLPNPLRDSKYRRLFSDLPRRQR